MSRSRPLRILLAAIVVLAVVAVVAVMLLATDTLLSVYERLQRITPWLGGAYMVMLAVAALATAWTAWRLLRPRPRAATPRRAGPPSREELEQRSTRARAQGIDVSASERELEELERRSREEDLYLALFGEASSGKSSLVRALLPDARIESDPRAGTTREATIYEWSGGAGTAVRLVDLPGFGQAGGAELSEQAREEAVRAHAVLYVCDNDLTRSQLEQIQVLAGFEKPLIVVLNKADRYRAEELGALETRIRERVEPLGAVAVVPAVAGGSETVTVEDSGTIERTRQPDVTELVATLYRVLDEDRPALDQGREKASLQLARLKLDSAEARYRRQQSEVLVERYARRAVLGALAAVTPGTDIVIQGALATALVRQLTDLYEVPVRGIDLDRFVEQAGTRAQRLTSISLAVAGNALKAFPGIGTLAGGLVHAVAYGLIFDSLGRAVANCLAERATLEADAVIEHMRNDPTEALVTRARQFARLALTRQRDED